MASSLREVRVFLGKSGVGKGTLVNCLVGDKVSQFGSCWDACHAQLYYDDEVAYIDTPGLDDHATTSQVANAITTTLTQGGRCKIFFLMRLSCDQLVVEDLMTVEQMLDSIKLPGVVYSIVVNNIAWNQYATIKKCGPEFDQLKATISGCRYPTTHICLVPTLDDLDKQPNDGVKLPEDVVDFIDCAPANINVLMNARATTSVNAADQQAGPRCGELEKLQRDQPTPNKEIAKQEQRHQRQSKRYHKRRDQERECLHHHRWTDDVRIDIAAMRMSDQPYGGYAPHLPSPKASLSTECCSRHVCFRLIIAAFVVSGVVVGLIGIVRTNSSN